MKQKSWAFPLRDDYKFSLAIADRSEVAAICKFLEVDAEYVKKCDGIASQVQSGDFCIWVSDPSVHTITHECCHIAFYVGETLNIKDQEFHCMVVEWLLKRCLDFVESLEKKKPVDTKPCFCQSEK